MENSKIEWTDHTFNPWIGCTRVSPGCQHCYAETMMDKRYGKVKWGPQGLRVRTSADYWRQPLKWNREAAKAGERRRVFCASLADVFEDKPDQPELEEWREELLHFPALYSSLDWLFLTKRPENVLRMVHPLWLERGFPPNVWIGTSVENQEYADKRIPELLKIPAARFLSVEPMLGPVDLHFDFIERDENGEPIHWHSQDCPNYCDYACGSRWIGGIDWVIVGGESGPGARPMHPNWVRSIRDQCQDAGVPFFFKQWGEYGAGSFDMATGEPVFRFFDSERQWINKTHWINDGICIDMTGKVLRNGADFHAATYPVAVMHKVGKKAAGRLLDGREWNEFPQTEWQGE